MKAKFVLRNSTAAVQNTKKVPRIKPEIEYREYFYETIKTVHWHRLNHKEGEKVRTHTFRTGFSHALMPLSFPLISEYFRKKISKLMMLCNLPGGLVGIGGVGVGTVQKRHKWE